MEDAIQGADAERRCAGIMIDSAWLAMVLSFCFNPPRAVLNLSENMLTKIFPNWC